MAKPDVNFIKQEHKKYQQIFKVDLPDFDEIIFTDLSHKNGTYSFINSKHVLKIDNTALTYNKQYYRSILYHEFTHQLDELYSNPYNDNERLHDRFMQSYSEVHASSIQLRTLLNEYYKNPVPYILERKIIYKNNLWNFETYMVWDILFHQIEKDKISTLENIEDFKSFIYNLLYRFYFIGYADIFDDEHFNLLICKIFNGIEEQNVKDMLLKFIPAYRKKDPHSTTEIFEDFYYRTGTSFVKRFFKRIGCDATDVDLYNYKDKIKSYE